MSAGGVVGMATGAVLTTVGSASLVAAWLAPRDVARAERWKMGLFGAVFVGLGTALEVVSTRELGRR